MQELFILDSETKDLDLDEFHLTDVALRVRSLGLLDELLFSLLAQEFGFFMVWTINLELINPIKLFILLLLGNLAEEWRDVLLGDCMIAMQSLPGYVGV